MATTDGAGKIVLTRSRAPRRRRIRAITVDCHIVWLLDVPEEEYYHGIEHAPNDPSWVTHLINRQPLHPMEDAFA